MNWTDFIGLHRCGFCIIGLKRGFFITIIKIASFFVSVLIAIKFYPVLSGILQKTAMYLKVKASILNTLLLKKQELGGENASESLINSLPLPDFLKSIIDKGAASAAQGYAELADNVSGQLANLISDIVSVIVLFIAARRLHAFKTHIQRKYQAADLQQLDKVAGLASALSKACSTFYYDGGSHAFPFHPKFEKVLIPVENSLSAGSLYENNHSLGHVPR